MTRDVMALLGKARPADLDPASDAERRSRDLHNAMAQPFEKRRAARPKRRVTIGLGVVAVGAAASVAVATVGHGTRAPSTPQARPTDLSARQVLLAAAETAAKEPAGRYWRVDYASGQGYRVGGSGAGGYQVYLADEFDQWTPRDPKKDDDVTYGRRLPSGPLTAQDREAWRKAGSQDRWNVTSNGGPLTLVRKGEPWAADRTTPAENARSLADMRKECAASPPGKPNKVCAKLKIFENGSLAAGFEAFKQRLDQSGGGGFSQLMTAYDFLTRTAVPPADRAKAFRLLADLPGVRSLGTVKDASGRLGIGLSAPAAPMRDGSGTLVSYQIVLAPKTFQILGDQKVVVKAGGHDRGMRPGTVHSYTVVLDIGWTNASPHHA
ncbi:hypothetical protein GCM10023196_054970 [Actinoallomurus vinaceus]|uniref:CU044_5270 family protein n=1 Tax=Actinoallomurus vinaceus TaxID=1080074 RepID=A0ABP8UH93_9ACTN